MTQNTDLDNDKTVVLDRQTLNVKPPSMYKVLLLNDDFTPMDFVVFVLQRYFNKNADEAVHIMLEVHHQGRGLCGIFPRDIASTKVEQVIQLAQLNQHPLQCIMEEA